MDYSLILGVLVSMATIASFFSIWYFFLWGRSRQKSPQGDASVIVGEDGAAGKIVTESETDGTMPGAAAVNVGKGAKVGDIITKTTKTKP